MMEKEKKNKTFSKDMIEKNDRRFNGAFYMVSDGRGAKRNH